MRRVWLQSICLASMYFIDLCWFYKKFVYKFYTAMMLLEFCIGLSTVFFMINAELGTLETLPVFEHGGCYF